MPTEPIRVLLADDHAVVRKGIREFLIGRVWLMRAWCWPG